MASQSDTNSDNLLGKRSVPSWLLAAEGAERYNRLEDLYQNHMGNLASPKTFNHQKLQRSFEAYITFVYDFLKLGPLPEGFEGHSSGQTSSIHSVLSRPLSLSEESKGHPPGPANPVEPKSVSLEEMALVVQQSPDMQIFRNVMLKIMCDDPIYLEDLERCSEAKLFNLKKLVFVKFKRVIDTEWAH